MPDLNDFRKRLQLIKETVTAELPRIAETVALSAKAMAERNIKDKGFAEVYSQVQVPAWFFHGKELNQRGTKFLEDHGVNPHTGEAGEGKKKRRKKKGDPDPGTFDRTTNWGEFRGAQGLQNAFVDLSYSNKMWANMGVVSVEQKEGIVRALLGATNREAQDKMNWNFERYEDFIRRGLTDENGKVLGEIVVTELTETLKRLP
jgi:hypothetical protein